MDHTKKLLLVLLGEHTSAVEYTLLLKAAVEESKVKH